MTIRASTVAAALAAALTACGGGSSSDPGPCAGGIDDGDACTVDACDQVAGLTHEPVDPDDGVACTVDACDPATGVAHVPDHSACGAGEICDATAGCVTAPIVDLCMLDFPFAVSVAPGATTEILRGDVWVTGVTEADGPSPLVLAQVGYGPAGTDPRDGAWTWATAGYGEQEPGRDEYHQPILAPLVAGTYAFTFRFAVEGGDWAYCDNDGAGQAQDDFDPFLVGEMTVAP